MVPRLSVQLRAGASALTTTTRFAARSSSSLRPPSSDKQNKRSQTLCSGTFARHAPCLITARISGCISHRGTQAVYSKAAGARRSAVRRCEASSSNNGSEANRAYDSGEEGASNESREDEDDGSSSIYNLNVQKTLSFIERTSIEPGLKIGQGRRSIIWDEVEPSKGEHLKDVGVMTKLAYTYYNWRTGTQNDIAAFLLFVAVAMGVAGVGQEAIENVYAAPGAGGGAGVLLGFWTSLYQVCTLSFGDGFPEADAPLLERSYAIVVATLGLVIFTILLAMVEQLFMEVLESQVERGSQVYEEGHMLVMSWVTSPLSLSATIQVLQQACRAYEHEGGITIVVLCDKRKTEMEDLVAASLPVSQRRGSKFIFREGSPLSPDHLRMVAARHAGSTVILSDASRSVTEADAQCLRAVVLLDDLFDSGEGRGNIVVELKTGHFARLMRHASCGHVIPIPTYNMQSIRLARMVHRPISSLITETTLDFASDAQLHFHNFPGLAGVPFQDLKYRFPTATVLGILNVSSGVCKFNPLDDVVRPGDELILIRRGSCAHKSFRYTSKPIEPNLTSHYESMEEDAMFKTIGSHEDMEVFMNDLSIKEDWDDAGDSGDSGDSDCWTGVTDDIETDVGRGFGSSNDDEGNIGSWDASMDVNRNLVGEEQEDDQDDVPEFMTASALEVIHAKKRQAKRQSAQSGRVLIIGWLEDQFMVETIREMDHGLARLRRGTEVVLFNNRGNFDSDRASKPIQELFGPMERIRLSYINGNPLDNDELQTLPLHTFSCIIIVCDQSWMDPDMDSANGIAANCTADMMRLDSMAMAVQVNVRLLLDRAGIRNVKIITEKVSFQGMTRFEDPLRLPLGVSINRKDYIAKLITHASYTPKIIPVQAAMAQTTHIELRDAAMFVAEGEVLSYWALMERVANVQEILLGWVEMPPSARQEMRVVLNPEGNAKRSEVRQWRSKRLKLITVSKREEFDSERTEARAKRVRVRREMQQQTNMETVLLSAPPSVDVIIGSQQLIQQPLENTSTENNFNLQEGQPRIIRLDGAEFLP